MHTTEAEVAVAARQAGIGGPLAIAIVKRENDVAIIRGDEQIFFLKTYTKPWYGDKIPVVRRRTLPVPYARHHVFLSRLPYAGRAVRAARC